MAIANRTFRSLIVVLGVLATVLLSAIIVVASSKSHPAPAPAAEPSGNAQLEQLKAEKAQVEKDAAAARKKADDSIEALKEDKNDLGDQLKTATGNLNAKSEKLTAAEKEVSRLRQELDAAKNEASDLKAKYTEAKAQLDIELSKDKPAAAPAQIVEDHPPKAAVARAGGRNKSHRRNYDQPPSTKKHDPGIGPRLVEKDDDSAAPGP